MGNGRTAAAWLIGAKHPRSLAARSRGLDRLIEALLFASLLLLTAGVTVPIMTVEKLFVLSESFSIVTAIIDLLREGEYLVAIVILLFSIALPLYKLDLAYRFWRRSPVDSPRFGAALKRLDWAGKWSMLDVFVAALVVVSIKASAVANAATEPGLYLFFASIVVSMYATHRIRLVASSSEVASQSSGE